jgi:hypothetical protein
MKKLSDLEGSFGRGWMGNALIGSLAGAEGVGKGESCLLRLLRVENWRGGVCSAICRALD